MTIPFRLTQSDIAKVAGVSRETCTGVLKEVRKRQALQRIDGHMELDVAALRRMV